MTAARRGPRSCRPPFYRSNTIRVSFALVGASFTWAFSPWALVEWRNAASLTWLHQLLPWAFLSAAFAIYTLLLIWGRIEALVLADGIGAVLWGWEFVAALATIDPQHPGNPFLVGGAFLVMMFHLAAARLAIIQVARGDK